MNPPDARSVARVVTLSRSLLALLAAARARNASLTRRADDSLSRLAVVLVDLMQRSPHIAQAIRASAARRPNMPGENVGPAP